MVHKPLDIVFQLTGPTDSMRPPYLHISDWSFSGLLPVDTHYFPIPWYYFLFSLAFIIPRFVSLMDFIHMPFTFFFQIIKPKITLELAQAACHLDKSSIIASLVNHHPAVETVCVLLSFISCLLWQFLGE